MSKWRRPVIAMQFRLSEVQIDGRLLADIFATASCVVSIVVVEGNGSEAAATWPVLAALAVLARSPFSARTSCWSALICARSSSSCSTLTEVVSALADPAASIAARLTAPDKCRWNPDIIPSCTIALWSDLLEDDYTKARRTRRPGPLCRNECHLD